MKDVPSARRYAKALYQLAVQSNALDTVANEYGTLMTALAGSPQVGQFLFHPMVKARDKEKVLSAALKSPLFLRFMALLAKRRRMKLLPVIFEEFNRLVDEAKGIERLWVRTAYDLSPAQKESIQHQLATAWKKDVKSEFEAQPDLWGGLWVRVGDHVWDASLKGRFEALKTNLTSRN